MKRILLWKSLFIAAVLLLCLIAITGIPKGLSWSAIKQSTISRIHLGLDLQGGTHLILQVHVEDAVRTETSQGLERLRDALSKHGIAYTSLTQPDAKAHPELISIKGVPDNRAGDLRSLVQDTLGSNYEITSAGPGSYSITLRPTAVTDIEQHALQQSIETIGNRVNELGVTEPTVQQHGLGQNQILVQLPGIDDPARVKQVMQETGMLEFRLVKNGPYPSEAAALGAYGGILPDDAVLVPGSSIGSSSGDSTEWYILNRTSPVSGNDLRDAQAETDNTGAMEVSFTLTRDAGQRMGQFTEANIGKQMAVVLDGRVREAAVIQSRIDDQGRITGRFTQQQAKDLALVLRSGALPASISYASEEVVGPSLGADSIHDGILASITGFLVVAFAMLIYYQGAGINAVLALVLNLLILMAYMALVHATLTLPGIAGIILTIGMAVDSNVLIFERIREEIRHGKSVPSAVDIGFKQAFITILDTHVTTVVSAIFLFLFGTGPIKGFAVTLTVGLIANLFTAVFVSRAIFDWLLLRQRGSRNVRLSV